MHIFTAMDKLFQSNTEEVSKKNKKDFKDKSQEENDKIKSENVTEPEVDKGSCYVLFPKDGDTFVGVYNKEKKTFRLAGINTPEKNQPWSQEATEFLKMKINKKTVYLEILGKDKYDREVVEVYLDKGKQQHVNKMLISEGLATSERYSLDGENTHSILEYVVNESSELKSQITGKGMWSGDEPDCVVEVKNSTKKFKN